MPSGSRTNLPFSPPYICIILQCQTAGSSTVKVKDEKSGAIYSVGAHDLSSDSALMTGGTLTWLLSVPAILYSFML